MKNEDLLLLLDALDETASATSFGRIQVSASEGKLLAALLRNAVEFRKGCSNVDDNPSECWDATDDYIKATIKAMKEAGA